MSLPLTEVVTVILIITGLLEQLLKATLTVYPSSRKARIFKARSPGNDPGNISPCNPCQNNLERGGVLDNQSLIMYNVMYHIIHHKRHN